MSGRHHSIVGTGPLSTSNPLPPPPSVHPPPMSHVQSHPHSGYHQSPASIHAKTQSRPPTGRSPMMRGSISGTSAADREKDYYRSEAYAREKEKEREREMERDFREHERDKERERERERERFARHRERERDRERDRRGEHQDRERERDQAMRGHQHHQQQQQQQQQQQGPGQHNNGHGPPPFHPNGHPQMPHNGPTTRNPLDMSHGGHPPSHLPPPPQASGPSGGGHSGRESRSHHHHHQVQNGPRTTSLGPNQAVIVGPPGPVGGTAGLTAAQVHTAIVKGTEGPLQALAQANEQTWLLIGAVSEQLSDTTRALVAYENALRHNPMSVSALTQVAGIARSKEEFPKAIDYYQRTLNISPENGEVWGSLGHCYLMTDDLQKAYTAYQQALYRLPNPKDSKLWYGIGILYDRYGSLEHAEEAFSSVLRMEPEFEKANEIYFRLGIIYKQQHKYPASLDCFRYILSHPPHPLTEVDIWFQIGHVYEQQKDYGAAKDAYERVLKDSPNHAKVLQQLGWLYHQGGASFANQDLAISYLTKSLEADPADPQSWYLLGRAFMGGQKFNKAYEAYQQAVYRDGRNPTFWCSIGVLYYQINQYRDALDAYSRAIRLNPFISEVWFDLGSLYESCNNQVNDAIDAYARASDLDPNNATIKSRLSLLRNAQRDGQPLPPPPPPQDVHPTAYASTVGGRPFQNQGGPGGQPPYEGPSAGAGPDAQPVLSGRDLAAPPPPQLASLQESAFRGGGGPPPLQLDEGRTTAARATPLAPMTVDRKGGNEAAQARSQPAHAPGPEPQDRRRGRMSPPPLQSAGPGRADVYGRAAGGPPGGSGDWDPRRREVWDDREVHERRGSKTEKPIGPGGSSVSVRGSPAPSVIRGSPNVPHNHPGVAWDPTDRRTPVNEYIDRRVSGGSDHRNVGPLNGLGKRGSIVQMAYEDDRRLPEGLPGSSSRQGSPGRYAADEKYRAERAWREHDARAREDAERRAQYGSPDRRPAEQAMPRPEQSTMPSPLSGHTAVASESAKRKRKGRGVSPDKESPRSATFAKDRKSNLETLNSPVPSRQDDVEMRSQGVASRPSSPVPASKAPAAAAIAKPATAPRQSGRVIDEDYDEGAADALMGLAGYKGTKEANGTSYIPIARAVSEVQTTETSPALRKPEQGHKRAISSTDDAISSEPKKARLNSPAKEGQEKPEKTPPVATVRLNSPPPAETVAPAAVSPAAPTQEPVPEQAKEEVVKPVTPKSPEPDSITEAVSGATVAVQAPLQASPKAQENGSKEKSPVVETPVEPESAPKAATPPTPPAPSEKPADPPVAVTEPVEASKAPEPEATPMEVEKN